MHPVKDSLGTQYAFNPIIDPAGVVAQYRQLAADYEEKMELWQFLAPAQSTKILLQFVPKNAQILEAGCGTGHSGKLHHDAGFQNLHGFDISPEMLALASAKKIYQTLKQGNLLDPLPYGDSCFDAIECVAVFTHISDASPVLREFHRSLKPGGLVIFSQRKDLFEARQMGSLLANLEQERLLEKVHQSDWMPYVTNQEDFVRSGITVGYFVYRALNCLSFNGSYFEKFNFSIRAV